MPITIEQPKRPTLDTVEPIPTAAPTSTLGAPQPQAQGLLRGQPAPAPEVPPQPTVPVEAPPTGYRLPERATVQGRLGGLLETGSPYIQAARTRAKEEANRRGLLSSSIAAGAGERAAIEAAFPIVSQDAATYQQALAAETEWASRERIARIQAGAETGVATIGAGAQIGVAGIRAGAETTVAGIESMTALELSGVGTDDLKLQLTSNETLASQATGLERERIMANSADIRAEIAGRGEVAEIQTEAMTATVKAEIAARSGDIVNEIAGRTAVAALNVEGLNKELESNERIAVMVNETDRQAIESRSADIRAEIAARSGDIAKEIAGRIAVASLAVDGLVKELESNERIAAAANETDKAAITARSADIRSQIASRSADIANEIMGRGAVAQLGLVGLEKELASNAIIQASINDANRDAVKARSADVKAEIAARAGNIKTEIAGRIAVAGISTANLEKELASNERISVRADQTDKQAIIAKSAEIQAELDSRLALQTLSGEQALAVEKVRQDGINLRDQAERDLRETLLGMELGTMEMDAATGKMSTLGNNHAQRMAAIAADPNMSSTAKTEAYAEENALYENSMNLIGELYGIDLTWGEEPVGGEPAGEEPSEAIDMSTGTTPGLLEPGPIPKKPPEIPQRVWDKLPDAAKRAYP